MPEVSSILQQAICTVAQQECDRLRGKVGTDTEFVANILGAMKSLRGLRDGSPPAYNEWDALLYISWYQYAHVNLAGAILHKFFRPEPEPCPIHVIDLGCGAMAAQIALAERYASVLEVPGGAMPTITVHNIDPSEPMKGIGREIWENFRRISEREYPSLSHACNSIESRSLSSHEEMSGINLPGECILFVMHAIYNNNKDEIEKSINYIRQNFGPKEIFISYSRLRRHPGWLQWATSVIGCEPNLDDQIEQWIFKDLPMKITAWRKELYKTIQRVDPRTAEPYAGLFQTTPRRVPHDPMILRWELGS